jgi:hypothetical protein
MAVKRSESPKERTAKALEKIVLLLEQFVNQPNICDGCGKRMPRKSP